MPAAFFTGQSDEHTCLLQSNLKMDKENKSQEDWFDFGVVIQQIGQFGWWQRKIFLWLWIVCALNGIATLTYAFVGYVPK